MKKVKLLMIVIAFALIGLNTDAQTAYITNDDDSSVSVINVATNTVTATIYVGWQPYAVAVSHDGTRVYIASLNSISVINTATNAVLATFQFIVNPQGIAVSPDGTKLYVTIGGYPINLRTISTTTFLDIDSLTIGSSNSSGHGVTVSPNGNNVYVTDWNNTVSVINAATNTVSVIIPVGIRPTGICVSPDGSKVYVTNYGYSVGNYRVSVIDSATNLVTDSILVGKEPIGITMSPDGSKLYVTNNGDSSVSVINTTTNNVTSTINVGGSPTGISITPDGTKVYVANNTGNTVSVINTATNIVTNTITGFNHPASFGNFIKSQCTIVPPVIIANGNTTFCQGDSVMLTSVAATYYLWNNAATTQSIIVNSSGNYSVTITDTSGCTASASSAITTVTVNPSYAQSDSATICQGATYIFPDNTTATTATVHISNLSTTNLCDSTITTTLMVYPLPVVTLTLPNNDTSICLQAPAFIYTGGSPSGGSYVGAGDSLGYFSPNTAGVGTHSVTYVYTDSNLCTNSAVDSITVNNCVTTGITSLCLIDNILLSPNPFTTTTTLTLQGTYHNPCLFIYNLLGQVVETHCIASLPVGTNTQLTINRDHLASGMYFYKVIDENKEVLGIGKMVVE